jgi:hypothetical protein
MPETFMSVMIGESDLLASNYHRGCERSECAYQKSNSLVSARTAVRRVMEREKGWFCENRDCRFVLWNDDAFFVRSGPAFGRSCGV